ncbi:2'-5' RNA ligase family protein [Pedobacter sp. P351]|uniref:2'-5' RNA ligase family protein n=1 Tax=Pedobacter superstes TaxID=3133441 RepID=UPI0030B500D1
MSLYLTAIIPPQDLAEEIDEIRKELSDQYKVYAALKPPVHITLYKPLSIKEDIEERLIKLLKPVCFEHEPFKIDLLNFDSFNIQTLYIAAVKNPLLSALQKDLSAVYTKNKIDSKEIKSHSAFHPHITIAYRDIPPGVFPVIWNEYKNKKFKRSFLADHFSLLKHDGKRWQLFKEFPFQKVQNPGLF